MADDPDPQTPEHEPDDPTAVVRVAGSGVRGRPSARPPAGRGPVLATMAIIGAVVLVGLALRNAPAQTVQLTPAFDGGAAAGATGDSTTEPTALEPSATEPDATDLGATPPETAEATVLPTPEPPPAVVATPGPTKKPAKTPRPDPGPTDSDHTDWTPPPGFVGSVTMTDNCSHADGTEEVWVEADFDSPVKVTQVELYLDGHWFGRGGPAVGEERVGSVIVGRPMDIGTTHVALAKFFTGPYNVDLIAKRTSDSFLVPQGQPCPGG
jgi:hypothetical protein